MKSPYVQGRFIPLHREKYKGTYPIVYRSKLELIFFRWCDVSSSVLEWASETIVIPYIHPRDGKVHRYFTDCSMAVRTPQGDKKYVVEIKPKSQCRPPKNSPKKKPSTFLYEQTQWAINTQKWNAAKQWCAKNGYTFVEITEENIKTICI